MDRRQFALSAAAFASVAGSNALAAQEFSSAARSLYRRAIVLDCNIGPPIGSGDFPMAQSTLDMARNSGVSAVKTTMGGFNGSFEDTTGEISFFQRLIEAHPDYYMQIRHASDFALAKRTRRLGIIFSFESATCLGDDLDRIDLFRNLGVRVMQLSYNMPSPFGTGVMSPADATLTDLGRQAIERMNAQGVAVDLSHANPATTTAAIAASRKPVVMTHGGCAAVHPHLRNKTDDQLRALANKGGVFGIFDLFYLAPSPRQPTIDDYIAHMTHALDVCGEDHVGIGSDTTFEPTDLSDEARAGWARALEARRNAGVAAPEEDGRMPYTEGLNRPDRALAICDALLKRGVPSRVVEKVLGANFIRVFGEIW